MNIMQTKLREPSIGVSDSAKAASNLLFMDEEKIHVRSCYWSNRECFALKVLTRVVLSIGWAHASIFHSSFGRWAKLERALGRIKWVAFNIRTMQLKCLMRDYKTHNRRQTKMVCGQWIESKENWRRARPSSVLYIRSTKETEEGRTKWSKWREAQGREWNECLCAECLMWMAS